MALVMQLDGEGYFVVSFLTGESGDTLPENWTADIVGNGYYRAQYQKGTRNAETGEWTGGTWVETSGPSKEDLVKMAEIRCDTLLQEAKRRMGPLQDAVDLDIATEAEIASLRKWKAFRVALNRLDLSAAPNITWPEPPEPLMDFPAPVSFSD